MTLVAAGQPRHVVAQPQRGPRGCARGRQQPGVRQILTARAFFLGGKLVRPFACGSSRGSV